MRVLYDLIMYKNLCLNCIRLLDFGTLYQVFKFFNPKASKVRT